MKIISKNIKAIEKEDNSIFMERELGETHSPFSKELAIFQSIKLGDIVSVRKYTDEYLNSGIVMGNLSDSSINQIRYWAVSTIAVAIHYAILGGLDETDAFNLSDEYIRFIDLQTDISSIIEYLYSKSVELTYAVNSSKKNNEFSTAIKKCIHYIHIHLHENVTGEDLAYYCGLSRNYLSVLFKKETGLSIHSYIIKEKMGVAQEMLMSGEKLSQIAYQLAFCSESHFIECFKKEYGMTPGEFKNGPGVGPFQISQR